MRDVCHQPNHPLIKLTEVLLKITWNSLKNYLKFFWKLREIFLNIEWNLRPGMMWWCETVPCTKNYSPPTGNEEYYTTAPQCETLLSRTLHWFAYFAASRVCQRSVFLSSIKYRINVEVEYYHSYNCYVLITRTVSLLSLYRRTHCLPYRTLLAVSTLQMSRDSLLEHSNCCSPNKTNNASILAVSVFILLQWLKCPSWNLLLQLLFSHIFAMAIGSRWFYASGPIRSTRGPLFLAEYA